MDAYAQGQMAPQAGSMLAPFAPPQAASTAAVPSHMLVADRAPAGIQSAIEEIAQARGAVWEAATDLLAQLHPLFVEGAVPQPNGQPPTMGSSPLATELVGTADSLRSLADLLNRARACLTV